MKVLGIDTSHYANAIGIADSTGVIEDHVFPARTDSLEKIVANIDGVLKNAGLSLDDIDGIGVGLGPGSWTGIRVGVTVGKMLAYSTGKPVAGIPTLEVLAYGGKEQGRLTCAVIDAGTRGAVYTACYRNTGGSMRREGDYYVGDIAGLASLLKEPVVLVGAEAERYGDIIAQNTAAPLEIRRAVPGGSIVALLAERRLSAGDKDETLSLAPLYLKESAARAFARKHTEGC